MISIYLTMITCTALYMGCDSKDSINIPLHSMVHQGKHYLVLNISILSIFH
jgi:hypothetical protein